MSDAERPVVGTGFTDRSSALTRCVLSRRCRGSGVVVREARRELTVGIGFGEEGVGLCLEELDGVGAGGEPGRRLLERGELDERVGELGGVAALLAVHAL